MTPLHTEDQPAAIGRAMPSDGTIDLQVPPPAVFCLQ